MRTHWIYKLLLLMALPTFSNAVLAQVSSNDAGDISADGQLGSSAGNDLAAPEITPPTPGSNTSTVNQAFISQASNTDVAYISQAGVGNYAAIYQSGHNASVAVIYQSGSNGYAVIRQN
jgi:hypothetical protein